MLSAKIVVWLAMSVSAPPVVPQTRTEAVDVRQLAPLRPTPVLVEQGKAKLVLPAGPTAQQYLVVVGASAPQAPGVPLTVRCQTTDEHPLLAADWPREDPFWKDFVRSRQWQMQVRRSLRKDDSKLHSTARFAPRRKFHLFTGEDDFHNLNSYEVVTAKLVAVGEHCLVYVDEQDLADGFSPEVSDFVVQTFDQHVYPLTSKTFGNHRDVDRNGKFTILFTHLLSELSNGKVNLGGFVRGGDFYRDIEPPFSNNCDMMYLNSSLVPGDHLRTLLAHEYTHAITFSEHVFGRYLDEGSQSDEQSWLSEAVSHLAENVAGAGWSNLDYRISTFLTHPNEYRLVVPDYYRAGLWRCHGSRGSTYLFLRWCVDRYGEDFLRQLSQSNLAGIENIEAAAQVPFRELFRSWCVELCLSELGSAFPRSRALSLYGPLERRVLTGVRWESLPVEGSAAYRLAPTSFLPMRLHVPAGQAVQVEMDVPVECDPQVTLIKLPEKLSVVDLTVEEASESEHSVRLRLRQVAGEPVHWEKITWELASLPQVKSAGDYKSSVHRPWTELFASAVSAAGDEMGTPRFTTKQDPRNLVFKALGRDASGRPVSAWGMLGEKPVTEWVHQTTQSAGPSLD